MRDIRSQVWKTQQKARRARVLGARKKETHVAIQNSKHRAPNGAHPQNADDGHLGAAPDAPGLPIAIRDLDGGAGQRLRRWIHARLGRHLRAFGSQIERIDVRFGDVNGTKGGIDCSCMVHVILSALPPVIVEMLGQTHREAFDLAAGRAERATRRNLEKHGFSTGHKRRHRRDKTLNAAAQANEMELHSAGDSEPPADVVAGEGSEHEPLFGKRAGRGRDQLIRLQQRPEKVRRDLPIDTSQPGVNASDRKVGYGHTGKRNTKLNNAGMSYALEDSTSARPSRKSSRGSSNRIKPANGLTLRTKSSVLSAKSNAGRSAGRTH